MSNFEDVFKAGIVLIVGIAILAALPISGVSESILRTFTELGKFLIVLAVVVFVVERILAFIK